MKNILQNREVTIELQYYKDDKNIYITSASVEGKKCLQVMKE